MFIYQAVSLFDLRDKNDEELGTSLVVQWLRLRASNAGAQVRSLVGEQRSHMLQGAAKKVKKTTTKKNDEELRMVRN